MKRNTFWLVAVATLVSDAGFTVPTTRYAKAQEAASEEAKYALKVPGGLAFS